MRTLPALLSLSRILLAAAVWVVPEAPVPLLGLMAAAGLTDYLDGWLARRLRRRGVAVPTSGAWLDPLCDKAFVLSVLIALHLRWEIAVVLLAVVATREILQAPLLLAYGAARMMHAIAFDFDFTAALVGKLTTVAQLAAVTLLVLAPAYALPVVIAAGVIGAASVIYYSVRGLRSLRRPS